MSDTNMNNGITKVYASQDWVKENTVKSWNELEDKPFYEEIGGNILIPEMTLEGFALMQDPIYAVGNLFSMTPILGQIYIVVWDGVSYDVECKTANFDGFVYFGNENYVDMHGGGDIPFAVIVVGGNIIVATESTAASHTISIAEAVVHEIDTKYIPNNIMRCDDTDRLFGHTRILDLDYAINTFSKGECRYLLYLEEGNSWQVSTDIFYTFYNFLLSTLLIARDGNYEAIVKLRNHSINNLIFSLNRIEILDDSMLIWEKKIQLFYDEDTEELTVRNVISSQHSTAVTPVS